MLGVPHVGAWPGFFVDTMFYLRKPAGTSIVRVENKPVDLARELIAEAFMANPEATHLFFMDADMVFPGEALTRLLSRGKDIVGGCYFARTDTPVPHYYNYQREDELGRKWYASLAGHMAEYLKRHPEHKAASTAAVLPDSPDALVRCDTIATGCLLISRRVFETISKPWFECWPGSAGGEDFNFCNKAREAGFEVWVDLSVQCAHQAQLVFIGREDFIATYDVGGPQEHDFAQPIWVEAGPHGRRVKLGPKPDDGFVFPAEVEGYLSEDAGRLLFDFAKQVPEDGLIVELGSYKGKSTICLAQAGRRVWAVDHFQGEHLRDLDDQANAHSDHYTGRYWDAFLDNIQRYGVADQVRVIEQDTADGPPKTLVFADASAGGVPLVDLLFVDAAHDYTSVAADLAAWEPFMKPEGVIAFDDCNFDGVARAVSEAGQRGWRHIANAGSLVLVRRAFRGDR